MSLESAEKDARRALNRDLIPARLGNGSGSVYDLTAPGNYYVRKIETDGKLSQPFSLPLNPLANIPPKDGTPVDLGYDLRGIQCIYQCNTPSMLAANVSPLIANPLDTAVYGKTSQTTLSTLFYQRHTDIANFPFTVAVTKAPVIINGVADFFAGSSINLAAFVPSSGFKCYAAVFLRSDMTLEAFASTPINLGDVLTIATDVQACIDQSSVNSVIICAWELTGGDTALSQSPSKNIDMRQIVNTTSGGTGSVSYPTHATMWADEFAASTTITIQHDVLQNYGTYIFQATPADLQEYTTTFSLTSGTYSVSLLVLKYPDACKFDVYIDNVQVGTTQDLYAAVGSFNQLIVISSIAVTTDGNHTFKLKVNDKNGLSTNFYLYCTKVWIN